MMINNDNYRKWARPDSNWGPLPREGNVIAARLRAHRNYGSVANLKIFWFGSVH